MLVNNKVNVRIISYLLLRKVNWEVTLQRFIWSRLHFIVFMILSFLFAILISSLKYRQCVTHIHICFESQQQIINEKVYDKTIKFQIRCFGELNQLTSH